MVKLTENKLGLIAKSKGIKTTKICQVLLIN